MKKKRLFSFLLCLCCTLWLIGPQANMARGTYLSAINVNGENSSYAQTSGTLPGTNPSVTAAAFRTKVSGTMPLRYDRSDRFLPQSAGNITLGAKRQLSTAADSVITYSVGDQKKFWVIDDYDTDWRQVSATVKKSGDHSYIFVDDSITVPDASLELYMTEFEIMYSVLADATGVFSDRDGNGKVAVLLYDMNDHGTINGYYGGYFWDKDYFDDSVTQPQGIRSNEMDIIYIRGQEPSGWEEVGDDFFQYNLTTLIHEYQHLVNFSTIVWDTGNYYTGLDCWIDEMIAMAAETMYFKEKLSADAGYTHPDLTGDGYLYSRIEYYNEDTYNSIRNGSGLTYWDSNGDVLANYALSYLMGQYLSLHSSSGQNIFKEIINYAVSNSIYDYRAVAAAASDSIDGITSYEDLLKYWAAAAMLNNPTGLMGYKGALSLTPHGPTSNTASIYNSGVVYRALRGDATVSANAGTDIRFFSFDSSGITSITSASTSTTTVSSSATTTVPSTSTTTVSSTSTTTTASGLCPAEAALDNDEEALELLRRFRDEQLAKTPAGRALIAQYYKCAPEAVAMILEDESLREQAKSFITMLLPVIQSDLDNDSPVRLTFEQVISMREFLQTVESRSSKNLGSAITGLLIRLNSGKL